MALFNNGSEKKKKWFSGQKAFFNQCFLTCKDKVFVVSKVFLSDLCQS